MTTKIFIDGAAGTTGLQIGGRLAGRSDISLLTLAVHERKDARARAERLNGADIVILCLPDDAAREAVSLIENPAVKVIDASTAHRSDPAWAYGFPELEPDQPAKIAGAARVSNPGCYPTGFLALVRPLVRAGLLPADWPVSVNAVSGYSGGGKGMIAQFEGLDADDRIDSAHHIYGLSLGHKHVGEMQLHAGLTRPPLFAPAVSRVYSAMLVEVPLPLAALPGAPSIDTVHAALAQAYEGSPIVSVASRAQTDAMTRLTLEHVAGTDRMELFVFGSAASGQARLVAALDNLGKGASGAAVQNLNIMAGLPETEGLRL